MKALLRVVSGMALAVTCLASPALAQPVVSRVAVPAPPQPGAIDLPVATRAPYKEVWHLDGKRLAVRNVVQPTLTPFLPVRGGTGAAVIVAPGGGFNGLAMEHEGWDVARWLSQHGIAAFVLKYRLVRTPDDQGAFADELAKLIAGKPSSITMPDDTPPEALADGIAALHYVRAHAGTFGVDPHRVGFMGFSAGGFLTRSVVASGGVERPDFVAPIYPNMAAMAVPADAPPMFVAIAADDFLLGRVNGFPLIDSYRAAGKPIEFHLFDRGGHGFGLGEPGTPPASWPDLFLRWLDQRGLLTPKGK